MFPCPHGTQRHSFRRRHIAAMPRDTVMVGHGLNCLLAYVARVAYYSSGVRLRNGHVGAEPRYSRRPPVQRQSVATVAIPHLRGRGSWMEPIALVQRAADLRLHCFAPRRSVHVYGIQRHRRTRVGRADALLSNWHQVHAACGLRGEDRLQVRAARNVRLLW